MKIWYKFKWFCLCEDENGFNYIKIRMVERFKDWKYDKFIPLKEAIKILPNVCFYEDDFDTLKSKSEIEQEKKVKIKQMRQQWLINEILWEMEY